MAEMLKGRMGVLEAAEKAGVESEVAGEKRWQRKPEDPAGKGK